jgi:uncharacterized protein YndB with AHSA1/START domain
MNATSAATATAAKVADFVISRVLDAPRELVWSAFSEPERIKEWWSPKGFTRVFAKTDFRVGGSHHYHLKTPDGSSIWGKLTYREIAKPARLVFITAFSDEAGGMTRHPMAPNWPLQLLTTVTFDEQGGKTKLTVRWSPINATEEEIEAFDAARDGMTQGWTGTLDNLAAHLVQAR